MVFIRNPLQIMNSNNTVEGVYCYSVIPECEPQLMNCPRTGLLDRIVCKVKIGRSEDVAERCEKEFSEINFLWTCYTSYSDSSVTSDLSDAIGSSGQDLMTVA